MNKKQKEIIDFCRSYPETKKDLTVGIIADNLFLSRGSVILQYQKLGFKTFEEFLEILRKGNNDPRLG